MRSDNLRLPCVQPPTSSIYLQLPHGRHGHGNHGVHGGCVGHGGRGGYGGHGRQDRIGQDMRKLTFRLDFPGNL